MQSDTAMRNKNGGLNLQAVPMHPQPASYSKFIANYSKLYPGGPIPQNLAKTFDGPPTLERSGSEHRRAVTSLIPMVGI